MTPKELIERARMYVNRPCTYGLGKGGMKPANKSPMTSEGKCDCSGFVSWCLGISRQTTHPLYKRLNGGWLETTAIWNDAVKYSTGYFEELARAVPGCIVVYPDSKSGGQGHIGIVSQVKDGRAVAVIHCSAGNTKGRAIKENEGAAFVKHKETVYAWFVGVD